MSLELIWGAEEGAVKPGFGLRRQSGISQSSAVQQTRVRAPAVRFGAYGRVMKKHPRARITFRWVAAHKDCAGNDKLTSSGVQDSRRVAHTFVFSSSFNVQYALLIDLPAIRKLLHRVGCTHDSYLRHTEINLILPLNIRLFSPCGQWPSISSHSTRRGCHSAAHIAG